MSKRSKSTPKGRKDQYLSRGFGREPERGHHRTARALLLREQEMYINEMTEALLRRSGGG